MTKTCVTYARVSSERQDAPDRVSIKKQTENIDDLTQFHGWNVVDSFVDNKKYKKTRPPRKDKIVEPKGEYDDRPGFLKMLELIETGQIDVVVFYDLYRFGRHPRVLGTFLTSLDEGNKKRPEPIEVWESCKRKTVSRIELGIMITIALEENETRARRARMGKVGTLEQGGWPGVFDQLGYDTIRVDGKRGRRIVLGSDEEIQTVRDIYNWYDSGKSVTKIGYLLRADGRKQKLDGTKNKSRVHDWDIGVINRILRSEAYTGRLTWTFLNGEQYTIEIPQIIDRKQWERVQRKLDNGKRNSKRNTKGVYLLQKLLYCGECGAKMCASADRYHYKKMVDGTKKRYEYKSFRFFYRCSNATRNRHEDHPRPCQLSGRNLDYVVWRYIADYIIANPEMIFQQVHNRQLELQEQGNNLDSDISRYEQQLKNVEQEKFTYTRQLGRGQITEEIYDVLMKECNQLEQALTEDLADLIELKENSRKVQDAVSYAKKLLANIQARMPEIDFTQEELKTFSQDRQNWILLERKKIIEAICEEIRIYSDGRIEIDGLIDGDEVSINKDEVSEFNLTASKGAPNLGPA